MIIEGNILKMKTRNNPVVDYYLPVNREEVYMNQLIGTTIKISYLNKINCIKCGKVTKTSFAQGYCFSCYQTAPETEECVLRPELCRAHEGIARDMEFAKKHCLIDHFVYLAVTGGLKVGVTRNTQIPTRWIDQGATLAIRLANTPNRYIAGLIEVALKEIYADKTNWRNMLQDKRVEVDLLEEKGRSEEMLPYDLRRYISGDDEITGINYPVTRYPLKVKSLTFDKIPSYEGELAGIKGQYLIFADGTVINIRKHNGYSIRLEY